MKADGTYLTPDEKVIATDDVVIGVYRASHQNATLSTFTYPAVGYWTDYQ